MVFAQDAHFIFFILFHSILPDRGQFFLMKEEIETKAFLNTLYGFWVTNRAAEPRLAKQVEVCVSPQPLPWVLWCDEVLSFYLMICSKKKKKGVKLSDAPHR